MINMVAEKKIAMLREFSRWIGSRNYIFQGPLLEQILLNIIIYNTALKNWL